VVSRRFALALLVKLFSDPALPVESRLTEERLLEALDEALAARIIEELPSGPGRYQFTHALMQETLAGELSTTRKVRLHARIALALEELYGKEAEARAAELVVHFAEAETTLGPEKVVKYSLVAGTQALALCAYEDAAGHFQRGLGAIQVDATASTPLTDEPAASLLLGLARATAPSASFKGLIPVAGMISRVFDYFVAAGQTQTAIRLVADRYSGPLSWQLHLTLDRALRLVPAGSQAHVLLLAQTASPRMIVDRQTDQTAVARLAEAVELADKLGDPYAIAAARNSACCVAVWSSDISEAVRHGQIAVAKAAESGRTNVHLGALLWLGISYRAAGEPDKARSLFRQTLDISEKLRDPYWIGTARLNMAGTYAATGEWQLARENLGMQSRGGAGIDRLSIQVEALTGNFEAARRLIEAISVTESFWWWLGDSNDNEVLFARLHLADMEGSPPPPLPETLGLLAEDLPIGRRHLKIPRATAVANAQNRTKAAAAYALLAPYKGIMALTSPDRVLGRLAVLVGDFQRAALHFEDALQFLRRAGYRPELAWTCSDYSDMLADRKVLGDVKKAAKLQEEGLAIARDLGMKPLIERILRRREILKA
jgi:tetratricopeptide (TPR) repeat protein